jgi:hypothetical protein
MINLFLEFSSSRTRRGSIIEEISRAPIVVYKDIQDKINK